MWINILVWFLILLAVLALIILFASFTLNIGYLDKKVYIAVYISKLKIFSSYKAYEKEQKERKDHKEFLKDIGKWKEWFNENHDKLGKLLKMVKERIEVRTYSIFLDIGVGNAMSTGLVCGAASAFLGTIQHFIDDKLDIWDRSQVRVNPLYNKYLFDISCNVIIKFKIIRLLGVYFKIKESGIIPKNI